MKDRLSSSDLNEFCHGSSTGVNEVVGRLSTSWGPPANCNFSSNSRITSQKRKRISLILCYIISYYLVVILYIILYTIFDMILHITLHCLPGGGGHLQSFRLQGRQKQCEHLGSAEVPEIFPLPPSAFLSLFSRASCRRYFVFEDAFNSLFN